MRDYVVAHTAAIINSFLVRAPIERDPRVIGLLIDVELRLRHHLVEDLLKRTVGSWRRLKANVVSGVSPGPCFLALQLGAIQLSIVRDFSSLRYVFGCANGPLLTHVSNIRGRRL